MFWKFKFAGSVSLFSQRSDDGFRKLQHYNEFLFSLIFFFLKIFRQFEPFDDFRLPVAHIRIDLWFQILSYFLKSSVSKRLLFSDTFGFQGFLLVCDFFFWGFTFSGNFWFLIIFPITNTFKTVVFQQFLFNFVVSM